MEDIIHNRQNTDCSLFDCIEGVNVKEKVDVENDKETTKTKTPKVKSTKLRELLNIVVPFIPKLKNIQFTNKDGDVRFEILNKDIGITSDIYTYYKKEIFSSLFSNFLGELLIRDNIDKFADIMTSFDRNGFDSMVNLYEHKKFGIELYRDKMVFRFHLSLLRNILTEDFKKSI